MKSRYIQVRPSARGYSVKGEESQWGRRSGRLALRVLWSRDGFASVAEALAWATECHGAGWETWVPTADGATLERAA